MSYTNAVRNNVTDAVNGTAAFTAPTPPMKLRLMTVNGSAAAAGTELATSAGPGTGTGYTAGGKTVTFTVAGSGGTAGAAEAIADLLWDNMPACTIVGVEVWDSAGTPKRMRHAPLAASVTLAAGDSFRLPAATIDQTLASS